METPGAYHDESGNPLRSKLSNSMNTLEDCIKDIGNAPELLIDAFQKNAGLLDSFNQQIIINHYKKAYRCIAQWFEFYLLNRTDNLLLLYLEKEKNLYKHRAEADISILNLVREVLEHDQTESIWQGFTKYAYDNDPEYWWFCIQMEKCVKVLSRIGLLDQPQIMGKRQWVHQTVSLINKLEDVNNLQECLIDFSSLTPYEILFHMAGVLAKLDDNFRMNAYNQWILKHKRYANYIKRTPELKALCLDPDGNLEYIGIKHQKISKKISFCNKNVTKK